MYDAVRIRRYLRRMDFVSAGAMIILIVVGVLFVYSASYRSADQPVSPFYRRQIVWGLLGLGLFLWLIVSDYRGARDIAWWFYAVCMVLLVAVLITGKRVYGAYRWLNIFGLQLQPSEPAKLATIIALARYLGRPGLRVSEWRTVLTALALVLLPAVLIIREPDLGTAAVFLPVGLVMMYVAGVPVRIIGFILLAGLLLMPLAWLELDDYQKERILVFFDPARDPLGAGWNKMQSQIAVGSGGLFGKGYLRGTQNVLGFLPRSVAPTDFIYSVIAEETGFVGSVILMGLFAALLTGCIRAALAAPDRFGRLVAVGVAALIFSHVFVNIAMTVGLLPITGLPLPLISYGGSFMLSVMVALGLTQSIYARRRIR